MMRLRVLLLAGFTLVGVQAHAGLFNDDEARLQIQQVGARVSSLEEISKKQAETITQQDETNQQQTRTLLDLQSQLDNLNTELRSLRGQNEELAHNLKDADKRQKDFYIDLDTRVRHFETAEAASAVAPAAQSSVAAADDPAAGDRAYEAAFARYKAGKLQEAINSFKEFLKNFPDSVYAPNAQYEMGAAYFVLNDYRNALASYQVLASKYAFSQKASEAMLGVADCQQELKETSAARKTLKQLVTKYPDTEAAGEAKKRLAKSK